MANRSWQEDVVDEFGRWVRTQQPDLIATARRRELVSTRPAEVRLGHDRIEWKSEGARWESGSSAKACLFSFLNLAVEDDPVAFLTFAQNAGVLGLTENGRPGPSEFKDCPRVEVETAWGYEPIEAWRAYARNARSLLVLTMALRQDRLIDPYRVLSAGVDPATLTIEAASANYPTEDRFWNQRSFDRQVSVRHSDYGMLLHFLLPGVFAIKAMADCESVNCQRTVLANWLKSIWIDRASIEPVVDWSGEAAQFVLALRGTGPTYSVASPWGWKTDWPDNGLFGVLAVELAGIVCSDRHVATCARCGTLYEAKRIQTHQANYCEDCRPEVRRETNRKSAFRRYHEKQASETVTLRQAFDPFATPVTTPITADDDGR